ncbi:hypothetical protein LEMLEM_LOCUS7573 [Lemmus lemmus]
MMVEEIAVGNCRQNAVKFHDSKIKFPLSHLEALHHQEAQYLLLGRRSTK